MMITNWFCSELAFLASCFCTRLFIKASRLYAL